MTDELQEQDADDMLAKLFTARDTCPMCSAPMTITVKEMKTRIKVIRKHFCTVMNGNCAITKTFYLRKKET